MIISNGEDIVAPASRQNGHVMPRLPFSKNGYGFDKFYDGARLGDIEQAPTFLVGFEISILLHVLSLGRWMAPGMNPNVWDQHYKSLTEFCCTRSDRT